MKAVQRRFFLKYSKSSAAMVTLALHALLVIGGLSFVVMRQLLPGVPVFVGHNFARPKPLPRLQPPAAARKPRLAKPRFERLTVEPKVVQQLPDIALPELSGAKGEFGGTAGTDAVSLATVGFAMPEMKFWNITSKGEKIFLILDAGPHMLVDEMGGIPAYTIIKEEMLRMVDELPPTAVFNLCVFSNGRSVTLFPDLVNATDSNVRKAEAWLRPLNSVEESVDTGRYGLQTLGPGGIPQQQDLRTGRFAEPGPDGKPAYRPDRWFSPAMLAMQQGADTVFLLTNAWGSQKVVSRDRNRSVVDWYTGSAGKRWLEHVERAKEKLAEENRRRNAGGEPPKVIAHGRHGLMRAYFPDIPGPPSPQYDHFSPADFQDAFDAIRQQGRAAPEQSGLNRRDRYTFNVVQFVPAGAGRTRDERFYKLTKRTRGGYATIAGLEAIQDYVKGERK